MNPKCRGLQGRHIKSSYEREMGFPWTVNWVFMVHEICMLLHLLSTCEWYVCTNHECHFNSLRTVNCKINYLWSWKAKTAAKFHESWMANLISHEAWMAKLFSVNQAAPFLTSTKEIIYRHSRLSGINQNVNVMNTILWQWCIYKRGDYLRLEAKQIQIEMPMNVLNLLWTIMNVCQLVWKFVIYHKHE